MINGNSVILQMGKETVYGTTVTPDKQIKISSESFKPEYNKIDEGLATGGRGEGLVATMGKKASGGFSTLMRPDMGYLLRAVLGVVNSEAGADEGYKHTFTAIGNGANDHLPSYTILVDRKVECSKYSAKCDSLSLSASAGDYLKVDPSFVCFDEVDGASKNASAVVSALKAFKFAQAKAYTGSYDSETGTFTGNAFADVTSINLNISNNLDADTQTTDTGINYKEPEVGVRSITADLEMLYAAGSESIRKSLFKTDATFGLKIEFVSDEMIDEEVPYKLTIIIPCCQMPDAGANMSGLDTLTQSVSVRAVDNLSDELIIVELYNGDESY